MCTYCCSFRAGLSIRFLWTVLSWIFWMTGINERVYGKERGIDNRNFENRWATL
jgi:hypothetical protein